MSDLQDYYYAQLDDWEARFAALDAAHDVVQPGPVHEALTARFDRYARLRKSPLDARTRPPWWRSAHPLGLMLLSGNTCIPIPFRSITGQQVGRAPDVQAPRWSWSVSPTSWDSTSSRPVIWRGHCGDRPLLVSRVITPLTTTAIGTTAGQ